MSLETHVPIRRFAPTTCALAAILAAMTMGMPGAAQDAPAGEPTEAPGSDGGMPCGARRTRTSSPVMVTSEGRGAKKRMAPTIFAAVV